MNKNGGPGSVVGIATAYGLEGPGIESRCGEIFRISPYRSWGPPRLLYNGYRVFSGGKVLPGNSSIFTQLGYEILNLSFAYYKTLILQIIPSYEYKWWAR